MTQPIDSSFLFPLINGIPYVGRRETPPHQGLYGPIGGKNDAFVPSDKPIMKEVIGGSSQITVADKFSMYLGIEYGHSAAIREFFEEVFQSPPDINSVSDIIRIGTISDSYDGVPTACYFYMANVSRTDFNLNKRELTDFTPLSEVNPEDLFMLAKVALYGIDFLLENPMFKEGINFYLGTGLKSQIPSFNKAELREFVEDRNPSILGAIMLLDR
ncbi:hypothetical protein ACFLTH_16765 [Bacteroidota bacterium]